MTIREVLREVATNECLYCHRIGINNYKIDQAESQIKALVDEGEIGDMLMSPPTDKNGRYLWRIIDFGDLKNIAHAIKQYLEGL